MPFYRTLDLNSDPGPDILQVEQALIYLGYATESFVADDIFDQTTSDTVSYTHLTLPTIYSV